MRELTRSRAKKDGEMSAVDADASAEQSADPAPRPEVAVRPRTADPVILTPRVVPRTRRKLLVTWSGGLDSTYGLVRVLKETEDDVFVHHIHRFAPHDNTSQAALSSGYEAHAVSRMLPLIRDRYRDFAYSESLVDNTSFPQFAADATTVLLFAGCMARRLGFGADDRILDVMNSDEDEHWGLESLSGQFLRMNSLNILKLVLRTELVPQLYTYEGIPTKAQEVEYLPRDLVELNASCRAPTWIDGAWRNCGLCRKCRSFAQMGVTLPGDPEDGDRLRELADQARATEPRREVEVRPLGARKHLVMWSGGNKSTNALVRLLKETDEEVHVHHVLRSGRLDRRPDERSFGGHVSQDVKAHLHEIQRDHRPFKMTTSIIGPDRVTTNTHAANIVGYFAAQAAMSWRMQRIDQIVLGSWGDRAGELNEQDALYRSGEILAPQMLKAIMRSEDAPRIVVG
jgi:hypothetical protein